MNIIRFNHFENVELIKEAVSFPIGLDFSYNNPNNPVSAYFIKLNDYFRDESNKIYQRYTEDTRKLNEDMVKKRNDILKEKGDEISKSVLGDIGGKNLLIIVNNYTGSKYYIGKMSEIKYKFDEYGSYKFDITLEDGREIKSDEDNNNYNYSYIYDVDRIVKNLSRFKDMEITFTGAELEETNKKNKKKRTNIGLSKLKKMTIILKKWEIINIKKLGDFILLNDEFIMNLMSGCETAVRKITPNDPFGEEDWSDEEDWWKIKD